MKYLKLKKVLHHTYSILKNNLPYVIGSILIIFGAIALWAMTLEIPPLDSADNLQVTESTKIYDRTGKVVLFDLHRNFRRTIVPAEEMSPFLRQAAVAIEDENFYSHNGIQITSIIRAVFANILNLGYSQGGSTITQQVIKNALLTREKTITRKVKEWVLALKLEKIMSKEDILTLYLNTSPYGGSVYGVEEASRVFFSKDAKDLDLAESAYIAALPQAPTYYSPFGSHRKELDARKNLVLKQMLKNGFIDEKQYEESKSKVVVFSTQENSSIKAPHFVMEVREQLAEAFGEDTIEEGGLKVITSLDYELQQKAEEIVKKWAPINEQKYKASNAAILSIDPNTGEIITMVGSRDYFDKKIDGNYNVVTALRQPGSTFKPIVYAAAFNRGYEPETVVFDVPTEFSTSCDTNPDSCYSPENYDGKFRGPISLRSALAQSINIPAVKMLYLVGMNNAIELAKSLGITTLTDPSRYGLSLVLGGGEVKMTDLVGAYGTFATGGEKTDLVSILKIEDKSGKVLKESKPELKRILPEETANKINSILSDNVARTPSYGANSPLNFPGRSVAVKTGTTNDYRDAWILGYTPKVVVGAWAGNNDNSSMEKQVAGFIVAPMWNEFMQEVLKKYPEEAFNQYTPASKDTKPIIIGDWQKTGEHSILFSVNKDDPLGPVPSNPRRDPQFILWEKGVQEWFGNSENTTNLDQSVNSNQNNSNEISGEIISPYKNNSYSKNTQIPVVLSLPKDLIPNKADVFINNKFLGSFNKKPFVFSFVPEDVLNIKKTNDIKVVVYFENSTNKLEISSKFEVNI